MWNESLVHVFPYVIAAINARSITRLCLSIYLSRYLSLSVNKAKTRSLSCDLKKPNKPKVDL